MKTCSGHGGCRQYTRRPGFFQELVVRARNPAAHARMKNVSMHTYKPAGGASHFIDKPQAEAEQQNACSSSLAILTRDACLRGVARRAMRLVFLAPLLLPSAFPPANLLPHLPAHSHVFLSAFAIRACATQLRARTTSSSKTRYAGNIACTPHARCMFSLHAHAT